MSGELQTRDKENQKVDSSEQYAINIIGDRTLQSVNLVVKESKRAVEKAMGRKPALPRPDFKQNVCPGTPRQAAAPPDMVAHTPTEVSKRREENFEPVSNEPSGQYHTDSQDPHFIIVDDTPVESVPIHAEPAPFSSGENPISEKSPAETSTRSQRYSTPRKEARQQNNTSPRPLNGN